MKLLNAALLLVAGCGGPNKGEPIEWGGQGEAGANVPSFVGAPPKNLLMISVDTLRKDHVSRYDPESRDLMPFVNSLMDDGFVADNHRACSNWTFHGVTCALGGRYPIDNGFILKLVDKAAEPLPAGTRLLAHYLTEDAGYFSVLGSSNAWLSEEWGSGAGYSENEERGFSSSFELYRSVVGKLDTALASGLGPQWFMHVHVLEPHVPYAPPESYLGDLEGLPDVAFDLTKQPAHYEATRDQWGKLSIEDQQVLKQHLLIRYEGDVRYTDDVIRQIFDDLDERGLLDDTLVVFWTDHGEQFWERGRQSHAYHLNIEENDAVLFLWAKNIVPGATQTPTVQIDIVPTILELLDQPIPTEVTGISLGWASPERVRFAATDTRLGVLQSVTKGDHQFIVEWRGGAQYHDLVADPGQVDGRYQPKAPVVEALWELLLPKIEAAIPLADEQDYNPPKGLKGP